MKKTLLSSLLFLAVSLACSAQWAKVNLTKIGGGTIASNVNQLSIDNTKLYAATSDGIWESTSANGADWTAFGLQGKRVFLLSFGVLKLALTSEPALDDATKKTLQIYKHNGTSWENTNFNPSKLAVFGSYVDNLINFAQIQQGAQTIIVVPTWGNGIWRSADNGNSWTQSAYEPCSFTAGDLFYKKVPGIYSFPGDNVLYGTDKADYNMQYMIYSEDYGITWKNKEVGNFFNPWSLHKRNVAGKAYLYFGGKQGNGGVLWRSEDNGTSWGDASFTAGVPYWGNRRMIGDDDGKLYAMCTANDVYVSTDNGDTFLPVGTGIVIPPSVPSPAGEPFFLTHIVKSADNLYVSTYNDGIYFISLKPSALKPLKNSIVNIFPNPAQDLLNISAEVGSTITVLDLQGKVVKTNLSDNYTTTLDIKNLTASVYIVQVVSPKGTLCVNHFLKK